MRGGETGVKKEKDGAEIVFEHIPRERRGSMGKSYAQAFLVGS